MTDAEKVFASHPRPWAVATPPGLRREAFWRNVQVRDATNRCVADLSGPDPTDLLLPLARTLCDLANRPPLAPEEKV